MSTDFSRTHQTSWFTVHFANQIIHTIKMNVIHIGTICKDYLKVIQTRGQNQDMTDGAMNSGNVKLSIVDFRWVKPKKSNKENKISQFTRKVRFVKPTANTSPEALAQIQVSGESENIMKITLETAVVKGLSSSLINIPLPDSEMLRARFGKQALIDLQNDVTVYKENGPNRYSEVTAKIHRGTTEAEVRYKEREFNGRFECQVVIEGIVTGRSYSAVPQQHISDMISTLKLYDTQYLQDVKVSKKKAQFTLKGKMKCRWECEHSIHWI